MVVKIRSPTNAQSDRLPSRATSKLEAILSVQWRRATSKLVAILSVQWLSRDVERHGNHCSCKQTLAQFFSPNLSRASRQTCQPDLNFSVTGSSGSYFVFFLHFGHTEIETKLTNLSACSRPFLNKELGY
jgi:hypothetical protein